MSYCILFSPSEDKILKDVESSAAPNKYSDFLSNLWYGKELLAHRKNLYNIYIKYIQQILQSQDSRILQELYGVKRLEDKTLHELCLIAANRDSHNSELMPAIRRYSGVAFQGLRYENLAYDAQYVILNRVLIFSNLFGVICARDTIPFYKLKQGSKLQNLSLKEVYQPFIPYLESTQYECVIDLRSSIYAKIWSPRNGCAHLFFEFYKNGKTISHYAKLYRGKILALLSAYIAQSPNHTAHTIINFLTGINNEEMCFIGFKEKSRTQILQ
ncbi:peroxide stress protein YaaA, partial [Helicobacter aurati]